MKAGALDRRLTLRRAAVEKNEFNEDERTWADFATVWASKEDVKDAERVRAAQTGASLTTRFRIRWSALASTVTAEDQLTCEGRLYAVVAVKEIGRREGLEITATAQADAP